MSRLPLRVRLTLAFAVLMAVVLTAMGAFLYARLGHSLAEQLDDSLHARADAVTALVRARGPEVSRELASDDDEGFTQVFAGDGSLLASSRIVAAEPLVSREDLTRAGAAPFFIQSNSIEGLDDEPARLLVTRVAAQGRTLFVAVGASLEDREEAQESLLGQLTVAVPLALLLSSLAGYLLAASALRPVEAMRRRAAGITSDRAGRRLPLPRARDEIRRLGETLNAMLDRLEAGLVRERRFVADASHELRTPLALLRTELELALRRPRSREDLERALRSAVEEVDRLSRLAEDLLVLASIDEGGLAIRRAPLAPGELLQTVARRFSARAEAEGRGLEVNVRDEEEIVGDRVRLEQALGNLVDNAFRYGAGRVTLEATRPDGHVELRVGDEGAGFPPEFLPRAFDRFARADEARARGAAGLGLAIVDAIVRAHGGTVQAGNGDGTGAVVSLRLPAGGE